MTPYTKQNVMRCIGFLEGFSEWYEKLLAWFLIRIESRKGWGAGFSDKKDGMKWHHLLYSSICVII